MNNAERRQFIKLLTGSVLITTLMPGCASKVLTACFSYTEDKTETFLQLSSILTGELKTDLDTPLALEYIERLERAYPGVLDNLLETFQGLVKQAKCSQKILIELVDEEIWQPKSCQSESYGGSVICDGELNPECCLARDIPLLWYAAALMQESSLMVPTTQFVYGSANSYLGALAWPLAGAHPQAQ